jgi:lambda family phage minor tail protein L
MSKAIVNKELYKLTPSTLIELFELDTTSIDGNRLPTSQQIIRFHNYVSEGYYPVYFASTKYSPIPVQFKNNEVKGDGTALPRPHLNIGNADGMVSYFMSQTDSLIGAKLVRRRTFARFLSGETWGLAANINPLGTPDSEAVLSDDVFYVDKVVSENKQIVEFELASILELHKVKLPKRRMFATNCGFEYRNSSGCDYQGLPVADVADKKFGAGGYGLTLNDRGLWNSTASYDTGDYVYLESAFMNEDNTQKKRFYYVCMVDGITGAENRPAISTNWKLEMCSRKINGCLCRFTSDNLPFGGFPALIRVGFDQ